MSPGSADTNVSNQLICGADRSTRQRHQHLTSSAAGDSFPRKASTPSMSLSSITSKRRLTLVSSSPRSARSPATASSGTYPWCTSMSLLSAVTSFALEQLRMHPINFFSSIYVAVDGLVKLDVATNARAYQHERLIAAIHALVVRESKGRKLIHRMSS